MSIKNNEKVKEYIQELLDQVGWVTYPQLLRYLSSKEIEVEGDYNLEITEKNIILWGKMSKVIVDSIVELLMERTAEAIPAPTQVYQLDGFSLNQPMVLAIPEKKLEKTAIYLTVLRKVGKVKTKKVVR